jgi:hypothetical protein
MWQSNQQKKNSLDPPVIPLPPRSLSFSLVALSRSRTRSGRRLQRRRQTRLSAAEAELAQVAGGRGGSGGRRRRRRPTRCQHGPIRAVASSRTSPIPLPPRARPPKWWAPTPISSHPSPFFVATARTMLAVVALAAATVVAVLECTVGSLHRVLDAERGGWQH